MNSKTKFLTAVASLFVVLLLIPVDEAHALRSTKQESFTDPDYLGWQPTAVSVQVITDNLDVREIIEDRLTKDLQKRGIKVFIHEKLFPPTREWTDAQRTETYAKNAIQAAIIVGVGESSQEIRQYGSRSWGTTTTTFQGNVATTQGSSTSTPMVKAQSTAAFSALMIDVAEGRVAWTSDIYTKAGGTLFVGIKGDAKAAVKGIVAGLIESDHVPNR